MKKYNQGTFFGREAPGTLGTWRERKLVWSMGPASLRKQQRELPSKEGKHAVQRGQHVQRPCGGEWQPLPETDHQALWESRESRRRAQAGLRREGRSRRAVLALARILPFISRAMLVFP